MHKVVIANFALLAFVAAPAAARTWIVVDQQTTQSGLHAVRHDVRALRRMFAYHPRLRSRLDRIQRKLWKLMREIRLAGLAFVAPTAPVYASDLPQSIPVGALAPLPVLPKAISRRDLDRLKSSMKAEHFPRERLDVLRQVAKSWHFTVAQVSGLMNLFTFDPYRLSALEILAPRLLDLERSFTLPGQFTFRSYKGKARSVLAHALRRK